MEAGIEKVLFYVAGLSKAQCSGNTFWTAGPVPRPLPAAVTCNDTVPAVLLPSTQPATGNVLQRFTTHCPDLSLRQ